MADSHGIKITDNLRNYYKWLEVTRSPGGGAPIANDYLFHECYVCKKANIFFLLFKHSVQSFEVLFWRGGMSNA